MPRPIRPWFRFYTEMPRDPKVRRLEVSQRWIWACILSAARDSCVPGKLFVAENLPMTEQELADFAGVKLKEIGPALTVMHQLGMVHTDESQVLVVTNFQRRQYESDTSKERTKAYRERHRDADSDDVVTSQPRHGDARSDVPETETETETEKASLPRKRGRRIQADWKPTTADIAWQRQQDITDDQARRETEKFRDHFLAAAGQNALKLDWSLAWKNWIRTSIERRPKPPNTGLREVNGGW